MQAISDEEGDAFPYEKAHIIAGMEKKMSSRFLCTKKKKEGRIGGKTEDGFFFVESHYISLLSLFFFFLSEIELSMSTEDLKNPKFFPKYLHVLMPKVWASLQSVCVCVCVLALRIYSNFFKSSPERKHTYWRDRRFYQMAGSSACISVCSFFTTHKHTSLSLSLSLCLYVCVSSFVIFLFLLLVCCKI